MEKIAWQVFFSVFFFAILFFPLQFYFDLLLLFLFLLYSLVESRRTHAVAIFKRFVQIGAEEEINVPGDARNALGKCLGLPTSTNSRTLSRNSLQTPTFESSSTLRSSQKRQSLIFFDTTPSDDSSNSSDTATSYTRINPHLNSRRRQPGGVNRGAGLSHNDREQKEILNNFFFCSIL